jgi:hypothetical protein
MKKLNRTLLSAVLFAIVLGISALPAFAQQTTAVTTIQAIATDGNASVTDRIAAMNAVVAANTVVGRKNYTKTGTVDARAVIAGQDLPEAIQNGIRDYVKLDSTFDIAHTMAVNNFAGIKGNKFDTSKPSFVIQVKDQTVLLLNTDPTTAGGQDFIRALQSFSADAGVSVIFGAEAIREAELLRSNSAPGAYTKAAAFMKHSSSPFVVEYRQRIEAAAKRAK